MAPVGTAGGLTWAEAGDDARGVLGEQGMVTAGTWVTSTSFPSPRSGKAWHPQPLGASPCLSSKSHFPV